MNALIRILNLVWKELLTVLKDRHSRFTLIIPPLIQTLVFGYAATYDLNSVPYVVIDQDRSGASRELLAGFEGAGAFRRLGDLTSLDEMARAVERRDALMVIQVPADFERRLLRRETAEVQVIVDGRNSNTAGTAVNYANAIVTSFNARWHERHETISAQLQGPSVNLIHRAWYNPNLDTRWNMVPGMLAMLTLLGVTLLSSLSVAREREQGTLDQLLVTPMGPMEVLIGKAIPSMLVGLVQATIVLLATLLWFRIPFAGSYLTLYAAIVLFLASSLGVGLVVSTMSSTMQQAMLGAFVVLMPFALLSGLTTPISSMPEWVQAITLVNPLRWGISIVHRVFLEGASFAQVFALMLPLLAITVTAYAAAIWRFRNALA